jgi:hypothetical protein
VTAVANGTATITAATLCTLAIPEDGGGSWGTGTATVTVAQALNTVLNEPARRTVPESWLTTP